MFLLKLLFCLFVVYGSEIIFAFAKRRCFDCVSIRSCESGFEFARQLHQGTLAYEGRQTFNNAICDYEPGKLRIPKVCCSDFDKNITTTTEKRVDSIEHHQNIGLLPTLCGEFHIPRLISSNVAELYEFPWMTLIAYNTSAGIEFGCAGSVINSRYILTAAHCVIRDGHLKKIAAVRVGELDYNTDEDCQGTFEDMICESKIQDIDVEEIIPHEKFTGKIPVEDDIALLRLKETINMTNNAAPICLPVNILLRNAHLSGKNAIVASWGIADEKAVSSSLMKAVIPILSDDACSQYYSSFGYQRASTAGRTFCAGSNMTDTCQCDSGGPLMMKTRINDSVRLIQLGIFSLGRRKCGSEFPDVYTDVTKYMDWILDNIRD